MEGIGRTLLTITQPSAIIWIELSNSGRRFRLAVAFSTIGLMVKAAPNMLALAQAQPSGRSRRWFRS
jgi:hypothetical protein